MSNRWRSYTSEKLFLADIQLKAWQECCSDESSSFKPLEESHKQSTILLMYAAWEGFLNELAEYHQQKSGVILTLDQLTEVIGKETPEVEFLAELIKCDGSWLSDLLQVNRLIRLPQNRELTYSELSLADNALIATSGTQTVVDSIDNVSRIWGEFKGYLEELRSRMSEW